METTKALQPVMRAIAPGGVPGAEDLARIAAFTVEPVDAERLYVREMRLCNDGYDREWERIPAAYLERLAQTLPGKSFLPNHNHREFALGRFYAAELQQDGGRTFLHCRFYMLRTEDNAELRDQIDAGVRNHVSVGFCYDQLICDLCGRDYYGVTRDASGELLWCRHYAGRMYEGRRCTTSFGGDVALYEAVEASLVYLGCQYDSQIVKDGRLDRRPDKAALLREMGVDMTEIEERAAAQIAAAQELRLAEFAADRDDLCETVAALMAECDVLRELAELGADGQLYRDDLAAEVTRLAGIVGAEKEAELVLVAVKSAGAARLKDVVREYQDRAEKLFPPRGRGELGAGTGQGAADAGSGPSARPERLRGRRSELV
jgi:hypothetical protein